VPHSEYACGVFWRIRGGLPGGGAGAAGGPAAVGLGDAWKRGTDNPHDLVLGRIRGPSLHGLHGVRGEAMLKTNPDNMPDDQPCPQQSTSDR